MKKILIISLILIFALTAVIYAAPGDSNDPIVVLSYLNDRLTSLVKEYSLDDIKEIKEQVSNLSGNTIGNPVNGSTSSDLVVVEIKAGEKIIAGAGTELILRSGKAYAIGSELGGLSDVTIAKDITTGKPITSNDLLIVPRDDGRGVYTETSATFMVRGTYEVVK